MAEVPEIGQTNNNIFAFNAANAVLKRLFQQKIPGDRYILSGSIQFPCLLKLMIFTELVNTPGCIYLCLVLTCLANDGEMLLEAA